MPWWFQQWEEWVAYATDTLKGLVTDESIIQKGIWIYTACGEIISSVVMASELKLGIEATCLTESAGIITDDCFNDARILQVNPAEIYKEFERNDVVLLQDFKV